jgi:hypothetical protein
VCGWGGAHDGVTQGRGVAASGACRSRQGVGRGPVDRSGSGEHGKCRALPSVAPTGNVTGSAAIAVSLMVSSAISPVSEIPNASGRQCATWTPVSAGPLERPAAILGGAELWGNPDQPLVTGSPDSRLFLELRRT